MANWFTRAIDRITPWDRGGELERRKKREEEQSQNQSRPQVQSRPQNNSYNQPSQPTVKQPNQTIAGRDFNIGLDINNKVNVPQKSEYDATPKPKQSFFNKVRDQFDANTEADQYRRAKGNAINNETKEVVKKDSPNLFEKATVPVRSALRVTTGIGQGASGLYDWVSPGKGNSRATNKLNDMAERLDEDAKKQNLEAPYKVGNVAGEVASYFTPAALSKGGKVSGIASKLGNKVDDVIKLGDNPNRVRRLVSEASKEFLNPVNLEQEARLTGRYLGQDSAQGEKITPRIIGENALQSIGGAFVAPFMRGISRVIRRPGADAAGEAIDAITSSTAGGPSAVRGIENLLSQADVEDIMKTDIPVGQNIPVDMPVGEPVNVPVRNANTPTDLIREVAGDANTATTNAQAAENAVNVRRDEAARQADSVIRPDRSIDGVIPRNPAETIVMKDIENTRNVINDALQTGKITEADHANLTNQLDETAKNAVDNVPDGQKIQIKEAKGIDVVDQTDAPQGLPETPGTVRATTSTAPAKTQAEVIARETTPIVPQEAKVVNESTVDVPRTSPDGVTKPPAGEGDVEGAYERLVKSLKENQSAQKVEKKLTKAEKSRRFAEKDRIYKELVDGGMSRADAEKQATKALGGKYADNTVANFDVSGKEAETFRKAIDEVSDDPTNTKRAFEHMIDPERTDPLQPWERTRIRQFVQKSMGEDAAMALEEAIDVAEKTGDRTMMGDISGFITATIASGDISAVGRQGLQGLVNHPKMSKQAFSEALGSLTSADKYNKFVSNLSNDSDTAFIQENMGTHFLSLSNVADEARGKSDAAEKFMGTRWFVNPSNRHYNTYLDSLRAQQSKSILSRYGGQDGFMKAAEKSGDAEKWMKAWGKVINTGTGRGSLGNSASPAIGDVQVLFSARNLASKFQRLGSPLDLKLLKTNPDAYRYQLKEVASTAAAIGAALTAVSVGGLADVENGKIKIGNTRYDISGGFMTILNTMNNIRKAAGIAHDTSENSSFARTPLDITKDFLQNQLSPLVGTLGRVMDIKPPSGDKGWEDKYGNPIDLGWGVKNVLPLPGAAKSIVDSQSEGEGWLQTAGNTFAQALGVNASTYQTAEDKAAPKSVSLKDTYKQLQKDNVSTESADITTYIADGDYDKASRAAEYNLAKLQEEDDPSESKIQKAERLLQDINLQKDGVPKTDDGILASVENGDWDKAIKGYQWKIDRSKADGELSNKTEQGIREDIKRSEISRDNEISPEMLSSYKSTSESEWRNMGDPDSDTYNADMYQKLWEIDEMMTKGEASHNTSDAKMAKYTAKKDKGGSGSGSGRAAKLSTDFGKLTGSGSNGPKVRDYQTMEQSTGTVPIIKRKRPNIVHTIGTGRL